MRNYLPRSLAFRTLCYEPKNDTIFVRDMPAQNIPAYTVKKSGVSKSQLQIARLTGHHGWGSSRPFDIASVNLHPYSSAIDMCVHGAATKMKLNSALSSSHNFHLLPYGNMQWKQNFTGSEMQLYDGHGRLLANVKIQSKSSRIEVLVPGDEYFIDIVVVTAVANIRQATKQTKDATTGSDIVNAIVGA